MSSLRTAPTIITLDVQGMTCTSCAARIEKKLNRMDGVSATVNYATEKASVEAADGITPDDLISTIKQAGYGATLPVETATDHDRELARLRRRLIVATALSVPVIVLSMIPDLQFPGWQWIALLLSLPVVGWAGWPFHRAALGWSAYAMLTGTAGEIGFRHEFEFRLVRHDGTANIYLEAAVGITTFLLAGRYFEARAKRRAGAALRTLLELGAREVAVLRDGT